MNKKKFIITIAVFAAVTVSLCGCKKEKEDKQPVTAPEMYEIAGEAVEAFPAGEGVEFAEEIPGATGAEDDSSAETQTEDDTRVYHYQNVQDTLNVVSDYCLSLAEENIGFIPVDREFAEKEMPSFDGETGSVKLARSVPGTDGEPSSELTVLDVRWEADQVYITVSADTGKIERKPERMTLQEALDYVKQLSPAALGLAGDSMDKYQVLALDGSVRVNGVHCLRMNVYWFNQQTESNEIAGMYLFNPANKEMYQVDLNKNIIPIETLPEA